MIFAIIELNAGDEIGWIFSFHAVIISIWGLFLVLGFF